MDGFSSPSETDALALFGAGIPGPPWILGHRGSPREAPENTLASLRRALELGLDGVEYDLHACATGEAVLIHDDTLERTTDHTGLVSDLTLPELIQVDAGGWFSKRFGGEPLPLLEEALELSGTPGTDPPRHMIELKEPRLVGEVARQLARLPRPLAVHIASFHRAVCLEARDMGLPSMLLASEATEDDRRFVRDERIRAHGVGPFGWRTQAGARPWECERWSWAVDDPDDLLAACRLPLTGFNTNEPLRALAVRALAKLAPDPELEYPLRVPALEVPFPRDAKERGRHGEWSGRWRIQVTLENPFGFVVEAALTARMGGGAFEVEGLPASLEIGARQTRVVPVRIWGGSWSPGDDPVLLLRLKWSGGPGRGPGELLLEAPLERIRRVRLGRSNLRLPLLCEHPGERPASMTVRLRGEEVIASIEDPGGLSEARALMRLGVDVHTGAGGVRARIPEAFRRDPRGVPFTVGFLGREPGRSARGVAGARRLRRFSGGLPGGIAGGAPSRLFVEPDA